HHVSFLTKQGHKIFVQSGAGEGSGFTDKSYKDAGAIILKYAKDVYESSIMIIKVKEPQESEYEYLQVGQILFTYLHLAPLKKLTNILLKKNIIAFAYETIEKDGELPLLKPMSEIAGSLAPLMGAFYLSKHQGSNGLLICGTSAVEPAHVLIIGNGVVARASEKISRALGARVTIIARHPKDKSEIILNNINLQEEISKADIIIGAVLIKGAKTPSIITKKMLKHIQKGSILIDVAIDQGGCFETSHPTTHDQPIYEVNGILHYCVANMPGAYPKTASIALSNESIYYIELLANKGWKEAIKENQALKLGLNICLGHVTYEAVAYSHQLEFRDVDTLV
ncbi:MAG TPA: alanine dehydrogenase, partial [Sulfurimonas sp.]|nr:alanine dehydrogenase [Sulfurimonas sp.]